MNNSEDIKLEIRLKENQKVCDALKKAGLEIDNISDLKKYKITSFIEILLEIFPTLENADIREAIIRSLTKKEAKGKATRFMVEEFLSEYASRTHKSYKWAIGNALDIIIDDEVVPDILSILQDEKHGKARQMLAMAVGRTKKYKDDAIKVLTSLLDDEEVNGHAIIGLRRLKAIQATKLIEKFLKHENSWKRKEAEKTIIAFSKL